MNIIYQKCLQKPFPGLKMFVVGEKYFIKEYLNDTKVFM